MSEATAGWLSVKDAAEALALNASTVYRLCQAGKIPHSRMGAGSGRVRFTRKDLADYLESCRVPLAASAVDPEMPPVRLKHYRPQGSRRA